MTTGLDPLIRLLSKLPGLGPRSARRLALHLVSHKETVLEPLARTLAETAETVRPCSICGNLDLHDPCTICSDSRRDKSTLCLVEDVADLWALERAMAHRGTYHVLGGVLSALDGIGPDDLAIGGLLQRVEVDGVSEVILALSATMDGQTTAHYLAERLAPTGVTLSGLAQGVPVGGELDYLDDGTLAAALKARRPV
ncbi:recombination mediator RecR [Magnetospira sp. QH-2]|uniref:recombination mediator RecR n=1 Tax=Magnetospira sp. (strain QH-2) TaxID=1288970 RepID=UPI0003E80DBF|nr:recombination mediator RecR [Magnetospira sp. QH-2]CCQ72218.1 Recombination protein recR [Magnetospira sp. QH-2]